VIVLCACCARECRREWVFAEVVPRVVAVIGFLRTFCAGLCMSLRFAEVLRGIVDVNWVSGEVVHGIVDVIAFLRRLCAAFWM